VFSARFLTLAAVASQLFSRPAFADPRLDVSGTACGEAAIEIERRLTAALPGLTASGLAASVRLEPDPAGTRVTVTTRERSATRGETVLIVASCDEAREAAVLVLSLAFGVHEGGAEAIDDGTLPAPARALPPEMPAPLGADVRFATTPRRLDESELDSQSGAPASRLSLAGGLDVGTLPTATAFVAASVTRSWSALELRGSLHYGLPSEHERVETDLRESVQRDFGALGLAVCYGTDAAIRVAGCVGGQFGAVRMARRLESDAGTTLDEDEVAPRVTGTFGAVLGTRRGSVRPEVELSGSALALGRRQDASWVAFRVAAGAAVDF